MEGSTDTSIEDGVYQRAARLLAVQHAVAEIAGGRKVEADPAALRDAVLAVRQAVKNVPGAYACFIGGLAVQYLGYDRWTDDVDVVVDAAHYGAVLDELRARDFVLKADFTIAHRETGAKVDLLKEGTVMKDARYPLPHPAELGPNAGYARIGWLIRLKLEAQRMRDLADVVEVLKRHLDQVDAVCESLPEVMREQFTELAQRARREAGV
ncbi:MAG: hypothetical protein NTW87_23230 [Planctomycetota bacterium]|nr:hypothetical protein [Planctomycetota bacterium]